MLLRLLSVTLLYPAGSNKLLIGIVVFDATLCRVLYGRGLTLW